MKSVRVFYYKKNFGDAVNENICENLFHLKIKQVTRPSRCEALFIGSNIEKFLFYDESLFNPKRLMKFFEPVKFWGPGFIADSSFINFKRIELKRKMQIFALRGELTKSRLEKLLGMKLDKIPLGDPGLLVSELIGGGRKEKLYKLGIIPHYVDKNSKYLSKINVKNSTIIDVQEEPLDVLKKIMACEYIISSSLHGLIAADSMGIPNVRMIISNKIVGGDYKYKDYYSVYGIDKPLIYDLRNTKFDDKDIQTLCDEYSITRKQIDTIKSALFNAFPYQ